MWGLGFIPFFMAVEYIRHRKKYCREYLILSIVYFICLPVAYYDALFYKEFGVFNWVFNDGVLPFIYRSMLFVSGGFLFVKGLQSIYSYLKQYVHKTEESKDAVDE